MAYVLFRGEYDKRRDPVKAEHARRRCRRCRPTCRTTGSASPSGCCRPEHPLTARVTVNRFWQELFGTGLVRTTGDFGVAGELPSHPELLDWLAVEFREAGWDVKQFFKLLVTSATYRQAAIATPEKLEKDPRQPAALARPALPHGRRDDPRLRPRGERPAGPQARRAEREAVPAGGRLGSGGDDRQQHPRLQARHAARSSIAAACTRSGSAPRRRPSMDIFNAPSRETCTVRRERTNTPLQALVTLNDPQFVEAARVPGREGAEGRRRPTTTRIDFMAQRLAGPPVPTPRNCRSCRRRWPTCAPTTRPTPDDAKKLIAVGESKADPALDAATLAAWTMLANELMNLDEVLNK